MVAGSLPEIDGGPTCEQQLSEAVMPDAHGMIFITGTSRGIGHMLASHYLNLGWHVIGCSRSPLDPVFTTGSERYRHFTVDLTDAAAVGQMVTAIRRDARPLSVLVNNAGIFSAELALLTGAASIRDVFEANTFAGYFVTREIAKIMTADGYGRIINLSSIAVPIPLPGNEIYAASKEALDRITRQMVDQLRVPNVTINTIGVSFVRDSGMYNRLSRTAIEKYRQRLVIGRPITMAELAHAIDFFTSDLAGAITGQTIYFGGPF